MELTVRRNRLRTLGMVLARDENRGDGLRRMGRGDDDAHDVDEGFVVVDDGLDGTMPPAPSTTTTTTPASTSRAVYPVYLPNGAAPGLLWISGGPTATADTRSRTTTSTNAAGQNSQARRPGEAGGSGGGHDAGKIAGRDVMIWRSNSGSNPVIAVTAKVPGRVGTLVSYAVSEQTWRRPGRDSTAHETDGVGDRHAPRGLRLFGEGDRSPEPSDMYYLVKFGPRDRRAAQVSVTPGALMPEDACICNPGLHRSLKTTTINGKPAVVIDRSDAYGVQGPAFDVA